MKKAGINFDQTSGGVYILSKFPATRIDQHVYDACRGEDCLKAKGVLHARLSFGSTSVGGGAAAATVGQRAVSTHQFIDVYATHMQADQQVCSSNDLITQLKEKVVEGLVCGLDPILITACIIKEITQATTFHCYD